MNMYIGDTRLLIEVGENVGYRVIKWRRFWLLPIMKLRIL